MSDSATLWTIACQALLSMGFSRQEYWRGWPQPPPGDLPNPGIKPASLTSLALAGEFFTSSATWEAQKKVKLLSRVWLFATPWTVACQTPLSVGFSRQGYWSELPFPSPGDLPNPGIERRSPTLWMDSLPSEPPGKFKNTGVGSLPLLQGNLLTQESNRGLLHCRQIPYQLSYTGSPQKQLTLKVKPKTKHEFSTVFTSGGKGRQM